MATFCGDSVIATCSAGLVVNGTEWNIEVTGDTYERTTGWDDTVGWKNFCLSWREWGGSWRGFVDDTTTIPCDVETCSATFTATGGVVFTGDIIITGITVNAVYLGQITYTVTFKGDGAPTCPGDAP